MFYGVGSTTHIDITGAIASEIEHISTQGLHISTQGLHISTQGLHMSTQDLHMSTQGLHISTQGLHISTQGLHISTQGLHKNGTSRLTMTQCMHLQSSPWCRHKFTVAGLLVELK